MTDDTSLEDAAIVGEVYDRYTAVYLRGRFEALAELKEQWPDGHYVLTVHDRLHRLVDSFERFWLIKRMLKIDALPIVGPDESFVSRAEWLRITVDLILVRLSSVRDLTLRLICEVYELEIEPRNVNAKSLSKSYAIKQNAELLKELQKLDSACSNLRDERNVLMHEGVRRALGGSQRFDVMSHMEAIGRPMTYVPDADEPAFDLADEHRRLASEIQEEFQTNRQLLQGIVRQILDLVLPEWRLRFEEKVSQRP